MPINCNNFITSQYKELFAFNFSTAPENASYKTTKSYSDLFIYFKAFSKYFEQHIASVHSTTLVYISKFYKIQY